MKTTKCAGCGRTYYVDGPQDRNHFLCNGVSVLRFSQLERRANKRPVRQYVSDREYLPEGASAMNGGSKVKGVVKFFNPDKGYGFIRRDGNQDVFVHANELRKSGIVDLSPVQTGAGLEFEVVMEPKGPKAINLQMVPIGSAL